MSDMKLSKEAYAKLLMHERGLTDLLPEIRKLEECGVDCSERLNVIEQLIDTMGKLKRNFGPGIPKS